MKSHWLNLEPPMLTGPDIIHSSNPIKGTRNRVKEPEDEIGMQVR